MTEAHIDQFDTLDSRSPEEASSDASAASKSNKSDIALELLHEAGLIAYAGELPSDTPEVTTEQRSLIDSEVQVEFIKTEDEKPAQKAKKRLQKTEPHVEPTKTETPNDVQSDLTGSVDTPARVRKIRASYASKKTQTGREAIAAAKAKRGPNPMEPTPISPVMKAWDARTRSRQ